MKVLFISHDAFRAGAQILFLNFLRWFKSSSSIPFEILLKEGGELESDFAKLARCSVLKNPAGIKQKLLSSIRKDDLIEKYKREKIGLVYSNTITNGHLLEQLSAIGCPVITHVHELENYIHHCGKENFSKINKYTDLFVVASNAVKDNLVKNHGINEERIKVVHAFIPTESFASNNVSKSKENILDDLSIPRNAFVVGASGTTDWRKSPELFIQLAGYIARRYKEFPIYFMWVGGNISWELEYDIHKLGLNNVRFIPHTDKTADYFNCMDVFALVSRIDPYPLVCLEAASLGKPIICFDNAGGMPEFVEEDSGYVVPYLGIEEMAVKIVQLYEDGNLCHMLGRNAQIKVIKQHDVNIAGPEIVKIVSELMQK